MDAKWYVIHVYSGFERKVAQSIEEQVKLAGMVDRIEQVLVPTEEVVEVRRGAKVNAERKFFPGYVLVKMAMSDETWHLVKNTPKVTGFLGGRGRPTPISEAEAMRIMHQVQEGIERPKPSVTFEVGEQVRVSDGPFTSFSGLVEDVPWLGGHDRLALRDETGQPVAMQVVAAPTVTWLKSLLFPIEIPPGVTRILQLVEKDDNPNPNGEAGAGLEASETRLANPALAADVGTPTAADALCALTTPRRGPASWEWRLHLEVLDDPSDTWSHSVPFVYPGPVAGTFAWRHPADVVERGPLRAALRARADYGNSRVWCRLLLSPGRPEIRLRLGVTWAQPQQLLRLRLEAAAAITERRDLVAGGPLARPLDRREYPLGGGLAVRTADGAALAVVAPEVFSVSVTPDSVNLTLLRSPHVAHHDPTPAASLPDQPVTDQGWHDFDIRLILGPEATVATAARLARAMLMPPIIWDLTG